MKIYFEDKNKNYYRKQEALLLVVILSILATARLLKPQGYQNIQFPGGHRLPSLCLFHSVTGYPDLGCGLTRSLVNTAHFRFLDAFRAHFLGPPIFAILAIGALYLAYRILGGKKQLRIKFTAHTTKLAITIIFLAIFGAWLAKISLHLY